LGSENKDLRLNGLVNSGKKRKKPLFLQPCFEQAGAMATEYHRPVAS
jgi:hypothetical protein